VDGLKPLDLAAKGAQHNNPWRESIPQRNDDSLRNAFRLIDDMMSFVASEGSRPDLVDPNLSEVPRPITIGTSTCCLPPIPQYLLTIAYTNMMTLVKAASISA
jgi:hypothetical protein